MAIKFGIINETSASEKRVAVTPTVGSGLGKLSTEWIIEAGAGRAAGFRDEEYLAHGFSVVSSAHEVLAAAQVILHITPGTVAKVAEFARATESRLFSVGMTDALWEKVAIQKRLNPHYTAFALDLLPRISRAQSMDVLSSMSTIAGYHSVLLAAQNMNKIMPMLTTAAGTVPASKVLVIGAGVAGLQAMATAKRLGAIVSGYDVRAATIEQIQSVGARPIMKELAEPTTQDAQGYATQSSPEMLKRQQALLTSVIAESDAVITTALVPGGKAPVLISGEMIQGMKPGAVIVDLAAERGGNTALTKAGETVVEYGVRIVGPINLASAAPYHASQMFTKNIGAFVKLVFKDERFEFDLTDEIIRSTRMEAPAREIAEPVRPASAYATNNEVIHG
jgi:NAD(P) transhydrogenase subunit alpha